MRGHARLPREAHVTLRPASTPGSTARGAGALRQRALLVEQLAAARRHSCSPRSCMRASACCAWAWRRRLVKGRQGARAATGCAACGSQRSAQRSRREGSGPVALATECARTGAAPLIHHVSHSGGVCMGGGRRRPLGGRRGRAHAGVCLGAACQTGLAAWLSGCTGSVEGVMPHQLLVCASITTWLHI